jgi:peroxiredoxin
MSGWTINGAFLGALLILANVSCDAGYSEPDQPSMPTTVMPQPASIKIGGPAPDFRLWNLEGQAVALSHYKGRVVMLNFWATWCAPCRVEMPAMESLYRETSRNDFEILAISTDAQGASLTRPFRNALGLTFPILHDSDFRVGLMYGTRSLPMTFLVDRNGVVTHRIFGARNWGSPEAKQMIQALVGAPQTQ